MSSEILIISNYFPPETGAAANRIVALGEALVNKGVRVTVVCPLPNYPYGSVFKGYRGKFVSKNIKSGITVYRLWHIASNSTNKFIRLFSMLSFCFSLFLFMLFKKGNKKIIVQCSPLLVGATAVFIGRLKQKKIILNVSDVWPLAGLEMGIFRKGMYYNLLKKLELYCYYKAHLILAQSNEIITHIQTYYPQKKIILYRNFPKIAIAATPAMKNKKIKMVYAGLLGVAQGISHLLKEINLPANMEFHIYGNGPDAKEVALLSEDSVNIFFHGTMERKELHKNMISFDVGIIPLKNRIYGSVPSKIFEYAALGLPIIYLSGGEGAEIIQTNQLGYVIPETDYIVLNSILLDIANRKALLPSRNKIKETSRLHFDLDTQFETVFLVLEAI